MYVVSTGEIAQGLWRIEYRDIGVFEHLALIMLVQCRRTLTSVRCDKA